MGGAADAAEAATDDALADAAAAAETDELEEFFTKATVSLELPPLPMELTGLMLLFLVVSPFSSLLAVQPPAELWLAGTRLTVGSLPLCSAFKLGRLAGARLAVGTFPSDCNPCLVGMLFCKGFKADP